MGILSAAMPIIGQGLSLLGIGQKKQDRRQLEQQEKLNEQQIRGSKELADYQQGLQLDTWKKTNYGAQMQEMKKAGLNPALAYGMSGGGATTTGGGTSTSVSGGQASNAAAGQQANTAQGQALSQMALMLAQIENIKADTKVKETTANNIGTEGIDTKVKEATIGQISETIENLKSKTQGQDAQTALTKLNTDLGEIQKSIGLATKENIVKQAEYTTDTMLERLKQERTRTNMGYDTYQELVKGIKLDNVGKIVEMEMKRSNMGVNQATINEKTQGIMQRWKQIEQMDSQQAQQKAMQQLEQEFGLQKEAIRAIGNVISIGVSKPHYEKPWQYE